MQTQNKFQFVTGDILHFADCFDRTTHNLMLVQTNANRLNLICMDSGNRWSTEFEVDAHKQCDLGFRIDEIRDMFGIDGDMLYLGYTSRGKVNFDWVNNLVEQYNEDQLEFDF